jgi:shikimate dehydrogenase
LGAGGAAAAIAAASLKEGISHLHIVNRTLSRAEGLCAKLSKVAHGAQVLARPLHEVTEAAAEVEIVINTTYLGMKKEDPLPLPALCITAEKVVCDAVYLAGGETALIQQARRTGARTVSGGRMLLYQGVQAQRLWIGGEPNVKVMSNALA